MDAINKRPFEDRAPAGSICPACSQSTLMYDKEKDMNICGIQKCGWNDGDDGLHSLYCFPLSALEYRLNNGITNKWEKKFFERAIDEYKKYEERKIKELQGII